MMTLMATHPSHVRTLLSRRVRLVSLGPNCSRRLRGSWIVFSLLARLRQCRSACPLLSLPFLPACHTCRRTLRFGATSAVPAPARPSGFRPPRRMPVSRGLTVLRPSRPSASLIWSLATSTRPSPNARVPPHLRWRSAAFAMRISPMPSRVPQWTLRRSQGGLRAGTRCAEPATSPCSTEAVPCAAHCVASLADSGSSSDREIDPDRPAPTRAGRVATALFNLNCARTQFAVPTRCPLPLRLPVADPRVSLQRARRPLRTADPTLPCFFAQTFLPPALCAARACAAPLPRSCCGGCPLGSLCEFSLLAVFACRLSCRLVNAFWGCVVVFPVGSV